MQAKRTKRGARHFSGTINGVVIVDKVLTMVTCKAELETIAQSMQKRDDGPLPPPAPVDFNTDHWRTQVSLTAPDLEMETLEKLMAHHMDVTGAHTVQIQVSKKRDVVWINVNGVNLLRICRIANLEMEAQK